MKNKNRLQSLIFAVYIILAVVLNMLTNRDSLVVDAFALFYGILIIVLFRDDSFQDKIYFSAILFAFLSFTFLFKVMGRFDIYFYYISTFIYLLFMLKNIRDLDFRRLIRNNYFRFLLVFLAYMMLSIIWSMDRLLAIKSALNYILMISLLIVVVHYNLQKDNIRKTFRYILCILPGIALMGLVEITGYKFAIRNHYFDENLYRLAYDILKRIPTTIFYNPGNYGVFIVVAMTALFAAVMIFKKIWVKITCGVLYLAMLVNLVFTTSRTAWISLFIIYIFAGVVFLIYKKRKELKWTLSMAAGTLAVFYLLSLIPFMYPYYGKFYKETNIPQFGETGSVNERYTLILDIVDGVVLKGNVIGFGVGNSSSYLKTVNNTNGITNPHSLWFEILGDFGLPIFFLFVIMYLSIMYKLLKLFKRGSPLYYYASSLLLCFFGFIFLSFAPSSVVTFTPYWIMMGIGISLVNNTLENNHESIDSAKLVP